MGDSMQGGCFFWGCCVTAEKQNGDGGATEPQLNRLVCKPDHSIYAT